MDSGEIFTKKSNKKSSISAVFWCIVFLLVVITGSWGYWQYQGQLGDMLVDSSSTNEELALSLKKVELAEHYNKLLKSLTVNLDSEVVSVDTPINIEKTAEGFAVTNRIQLAFFNNSEQQVQISNISPHIAKQSDHTYEVDIHLTQQEIQDIVIPPLGKVTTDIFFTTTAECLLKSFAVSWQYDYGIHDASLDFIFQDNEKLRKQAELATTNKGIASQIVLNHSNLKSIQEQSENFCQYEL